MANKNSKAPVLKRECPKCGTKAMRPMVEKKTVFLESEIRKCYTLFCPKCRALWEVNFVYPYERTEIKILEN